MAPPGRTLVAAALAVAAVLVVYAVYVSTGVPGAVTSPVPSSFTVNGRTYAFNYTATDQAQREAGLMNKKVTNATTMLFAFPSYGLWQFWMYDTNTSLDMVWVNATGTSARVVYLVTSAQPCFDDPSSNCMIYTPAAAANYVIEAKAGFAATNGIIVGTDIQFG